MNTSEAKEKLLFYRGRIDDADPRFQEALAQARRDPELAEWLREQASCYHVIRSKLREVEPPGDLAEKIMQNRPILFRRDSKQILKLAAAINLLRRLQREWSGTRFVREGLHQKRVAGWDKR